MWCLCVRRCWGSDWLEMGDWRGIITELTLTLLFDDQVMSRVGQLL